MRELVSASTSVAADEGGSGASSASNPIRVPLSGGKGKGKRGRKPKNEGKTADSDTISCDIMKIPRTKPESGPGRWTNQLQFIKEKVIKAMTRHRAIKMFKEPINPVEMGIPNYYDFVDRPMDLTTIRTRLNNRYYQNGADECLQDFQLMFVNCYVYNYPNTVVVQEANDLECTLLRKLMEMPEPEEDYKPGRDRSRSKNQSISESCDGGERSEDQKEEESAGAGGRKSLRIKQVIEKPVPDSDHGQGSGGKVLRRPEKKTDDDDSSSSSSSSEEDEEEIDDKSDNMQPSTVPHSYSSDASGENEEEDVDDDGLVMDPVKKERLRVLRTMQTRRKAYLKLLQRQLNNVNEQISAVMQEEKEDAEEIKKLTGGSSGTSSIGGGGGGGKSSKKKFSTFTSSAKRKVPTKKTTKTTAAKPKATPQKKTTPVAAAEPKLTCSAPLIIQNPTASSSKKRPSSVASSKEDASDPKGISPVKPPPPKKAKVSTSRRSSVCSPPRPSTSSTSNKAPSKKSDGRGRPLGSTKKAKEVAVATTTKTSETPSTSTAHATATTSGSGQRPLTTQQIAKLNLMVDQLEPDEQLELVEMTTPYDQGGGDVDECLFDITKLPPVCQWEMKTFVEETLEKKAKASEVPKLAKVVVKAAGPPPQQSKKKVEKKEVSTITFHAKSPSPASPPPPDVTSSTSPKEKYLIPQNTVPTVMDEDSRDSLANSSDSDENLFIAVTVKTPPKKDAEVKTTPPASKKTLAEAVEENLDYGGDDDDEDDLLDEY